ncbi:Plant UBX domain-containing protein 4 [Raphanus sativus]|nr:Plant UBX domain-containing protein 4 [Raphanus sativus]
MKIHRIAVRRKKKNPSKKDDVDEIFNQARQLGAVEGPLETPSSSSSRSFTGTGRLLSGGESVSTAPPQQPDPVAHTIIFWSDGFTIDDGPLRKLDDPDNASFLEVLHLNQNVLLSFLCLTYVFLFCRVFESLSVQKSLSLKIEETDPTTSIQIRLTDGTRLVGKFNHHHTVHDIRAFIDSSRPGAPVNYQLQTTGFPPTPLADLAQTIQQAGLANSVVLQKF